MRKPDFDFWDAFEKRLNQLFDLGIQVDLILFHPYDRWGFSTLTQEENLIYLDYVVRRLSAYPNIWWSCRLRPKREWQFFVQQSRDEFFRKEKVMKKTMKRIGALFLGGVLAVGILTGCTNDNRIMMNLVY